MISYWLWTMCQRSSCELSWWYFGKIKAKRVFGITRTFLGSGARFSVVRRRQSNIAIHKAILWPSGSREKRQWITSWNDEMDEKKYWEEILSSRPVGTVYPNWGPRNIYSWRITPLNLWLELLSTFRLSFPIRPRSLFSTVSPFSNHRSILKKRTPS